MQNRTGRKQFKYQSPYFKLNGQLPDMKTIQFFGQKCFVQNTMPITPKLSNRSDEALFLGYCDNSVAFKVYLNNSVRIAQHVTFTKQEVMEEVAQIDNPTINSEARYVEAPSVVPFVTLPISVPSTTPTTTTSTTTTSTDSTPITRHSTRQGFQATMSRINESSCLKRRILKVSSDLTTLNEIPAHEFPSDSIGYKPSLKGPLAPYWKEARHTEIQNWFDQEVAEISDLPDGCKAIPGHWIHTAKRNAQGDVVRLKARCVVDGNHQVYGRDFLETYAATPAPEIARLLLTVAAEKNWEVHQMDVDCAYLNAPLDEPVYMQIPPGIDVDRKQGQVFKLVKALYGLKQAGHEWAKHLKGILQSLGWKQS